MRKIAVTIALLILIVACSPSVEEEQPPVLSEVEEEVEGSTVTKVAKSTQPSPVPEATSAETGETEEPAVGETALPGQSVPTPPAGHIYHAIYPGEAIADSKPPPEDGIPFEEDGVTLGDLRSYEQYVGKTATWVYFSHNWFRERRFPLSTASWIRDAGSIPFIRLMLRSSSEQNVAEPTFTLDRIINGDFDDDLRTWARGARDFGSPLIAEYGTEANGEWFSWNGSWNGAGTEDGYGDPSEYDGPERFRDAYRHIIQIAQDEGASNITWVFHANGDDIPDEAWNRLEEYYPGDEWIDWLGVSVYGALTPTDDEWVQFRDGMDAAYPRLATLSPEKPIVLLEFGVTSGNPLGDQAEWAEAALTDLVVFRWPRLIGFSWWNEFWENDDDPSHDSILRVQDNPDLIAVFQRLVGNEPKVLGHVSPSATSITEQAATAVPASRGKTHLAAVTHWFYMIDVNLEPEMVERMAASEYDMVVLDFIPSEANNTDYPIAEVVDRLHNADHPKLVLAYIDIGQAEDFRAYWQPDWGIGDPEWIVGSDPDGWTGNYPVAYWYEEWQEIWLGPDGMLQAILDAGFDGIYLDWVEAYSDENVVTFAESDGVDPRQEMIWWVEDMADFTRSQRADFIVIAQNAAELAQDDDYVEVIDAIAQEQVWFDGAADNEPPGDCPLPRTEAETETEAYVASLSEPCRTMYEEFPDSTLHASSEEYLQDLTLAQSKGVLIFTVDYALKPENVAWVYETSRELGFVPFVGNRALNQYVAPVIETTITAAAGKNWWQPGVDTTWQWQLLDQPIDQSYDADMYDIDLFDNDASVVAALHSQGRKVVCYISVGSWEEWRPDADQFPASVIGNDYGGWSGEKWLDIRQLDLLAPIIRARLDECQAKGFDGIEPDNIDSYTNDTGFPLTYEDQLKYNSWLANEAHARGLSIGLKNDPDQVADLLPHFDWALTEDCFAEDWCVEMLPFIAAGKPVFAAEYTDTGITPDQFCPQAQGMGFSAILKNRNLEAYQEACRYDEDEPETTPPLEEAPAADVLLLQRDFALPSPLFASNSAWNQTAAGVAVLPESDQQILVTYRVLRGDIASIFGYEEPPTTWPFMDVSLEEYAIPIFRAGIEQQKVLLCNYEGDQEWPHPKFGLDRQGGPVTVPAPAGMVRPAGPENTDADGHLVLYNPETFEEYDFWQATTMRNAECESVGGGRAGSTILEAGVIDFFDVRGSGANPDTYYSARAHGTPLLAGMILPEDIENGEIAHALALAIPGPRNLSADPSEPLSSDYFYPASTTETDFFNTNPHALAAGQRIRLKQTIVDDEGDLIDESQLTPITRMFLTGLRTYGAYLVDNAGGFSFTAEDIHTAVLHLSNEEINTLIGQPPGAPLPAGKTKWEVVIDKLTEELERIPIAYGPWEEGQDPATAMIEISNFEVVEPTFTP